MGIQHIVGGVCTYTLILCWYIVNKLIVHWYIFLCLLCVVVFLGRLVKQLSIFLLFCGCKYRFELIGEHRLVFMEFIFMRFLCITRKHTSHLRIFDFASTILSRFLSLSLFFSSSYFFYRDFSAHKPSVVNSIAF